MAGRDLEGASGSPRQYFRWNDIRPTICKDCFLNTAFQKIIEQETPISFWGFLKSDNLEVLFRARHQRRESLQISAALLLVIAITLAFAPVDRYIFGSGPALQCLWEGRLTLVTLAVILLFANRRPGRSAASLDRSLFLYGLCGAAFMMGLGAAMPAAHFAGYL